MPRELVPAAASGGLEAEVIDVDDLAALASAVAGRQASPETRRTYAGVYGAFCAFVGLGAGRETVCAERVAAYRDRLEAAGRSPATIAKHLAALRTLAGALGVAELDELGTARVARGQPRALRGEQYARLLRMPDRRTRLGKRDLALLHLLGSVGLRRSEASTLRVGDVEERRRSADPRMRALIARSTGWWAVVRHGKRGSSRAVPLAEDALEAIVDWVRVRPACAAEHLLVSMTRAGRPPRALSARDVGRIVARHAAAAGLPDGRRGPHVLRHTFCTHLAQAGAVAEEIQLLAGHADIRTTMIYTEVETGRLERAVADTSRQRRHGLERLAAG